MLQSYKSGMLISTLQGTGEKLRTGSAWKGAGWGGQERVRAGRGGRNDPNDVCTYEQMNNNEKKKPILV
jgi:hypothetical protein